MPKPRVFIGSSSEGLAVAEAIFAILSHDFDPTLWTNEIFTPGAYPLEALDGTIRANAFGILVASADDQLLKRGNSGPVMRDNVMLEFGLFVGAYGRRRVFFVCPDKPKLALPSDLDGLIAVKYNAGRVRRSESDRAAAVQAACSQIRNAIRREMKAEAVRERKLRDSLRASQETQAMQRLNTVATQLRDVLVIMQRESVAVLTDKAAFQEVKKRAANEVIRLSASFFEDANAVGVQIELEELRDATAAAILDLPFPRELSVKRAIATKKVVAVGFQALDVLLTGGDAVGHVRTTARIEVGRRLQALSHRYEQWWHKHSPRLYTATADLQRAIFDGMVRLASMNARIAG
jgi:hypothetical protein